MQEPQEPPTVVPMPAPPKSKRSPVLPILLLVGAGLLLAWAANEVSNSRSTTIPEDGIPGGNDSQPTVAFEVLDCSSEYGYATALVEFRSDEPLSYISFTGDYINEDGISIGQGLGNATDIVPGQTYRTEVLYSLNGRARGGTCQVNLDDMYD